MGYEIKGSNTLYKVWGIITYIFTGFYCAARAIVLISLGMGVRSLWSDISGLVDTDKLRDATVPLILAVVLSLLVTIGGAAVRITAGTYLVRAYVRSKGPLIVVSVFYFAITLVDLGAVLVCITSGLEWSGVIFIMLLYLFRMGWGIATGIFLIMKQAAAVTEKRGEHQEGDDGSHDGDSRMDGPEPRACIEGLFGDYIGRRYILRSGENCRIGRDPGCDIQLDHPKVSRIHCAVKLLPAGRFEVTDYSFNGTYYENNSLPNGDAITVDAGGMLVVGCPDNVFSLNICDDRISYQ